MMSQWLVAVVPERTNAVHSSFSSRRPIRSFMLAGAVMLACGLVGLPASAQESRPQDPQAQAAPSDPKAATHRRRRKRHPFASHGRTSQRDGYAGRGPGGNG